MGSVIALVPDNVSQASLFGWVTKIFGQSIHCWRISRKRRKQEVAPFHITVLPILSANLSRVTAAHQGTTAETQSANPRLGMVFVGKF